MIEPSQIRLFLTVAPLMREHGRNRWRVKIGPASEAKSKLGDVAGQIEVGLVKGADRADVFPVAVKEVGLHAVADDGLRQYLVAKVGGGAASQQVDQERSVKEVNAHARQVRPASRAQYPGSRASWDQCARG